MELALNHYYSQQKIFGAAGDFITAPEISQLFGEMIGIFWFSCWQNMGFCRQLGLIEYGPGRGTMFADALRIFCQLARKSSLPISGVKGFLVENSPALRECQRQKLADAEIEITWLDSELPAMPLIITGNEFLDALPIKQFNAAEVERKIILTRDKLEFTYPSHEVVREECPAAMAIIAEISAHLLRHSGYALFVDYGYNKGGGDSLQAVRNHQYADVLADAGDADITAHVDFSAIAQRAISAGASCHGTVSQRHFLQSLGIEARALSLATANPLRQREIYSGMHRLIAPNEMGELFKACCISSPELRGFTDA
jgi:SAM-dependent MidA family methyltransferase